MTKLEVIPGGGGGKPDAQLDLKAKLREVRRIRAEAVRWRAGRTSPRKSLAFGWSMLSFLTTLGVGEVVRRTLDVGLSALALSAVGAGVAFAVSTGVMLRSKAPLTQAGLLDSLLNDYTPVSVSDFRSLQAAVVASGDIEPELVLRWAEVEIEAINAAAGVPMRPTLDFLNKKV